MNTCKKHGVVYTRKPGKFYVLRICYRCKVEAGRQGGRTPRIKK